MPLLQTGRKSAIVAAAIHITTSTVGLINTTVRQQRSDQGRKNSGHNEATILAILTGGPVQNTFSARSAKPATRNAFPQRGNSFQEGCLAVKIAVAGSVS